MQEDGIVKPWTTKTAVFEELGQNTGLTKKRVGSVFDALGVLIERHLKPSSTGRFALPGRLKIEVKKKPATKARKGKNPFTGEETVFKAQPARRGVPIECWWQAAAWRSSKLEFRFRLVDHW